MLPHHIIFCCPITSKNNKKLLPHQVLFARSPSSIYILCTVCLSLPMGAHQYNSFNLFLQHHVAASAGMVLIARIVIQRGWDEVLDFEKGYFFHPLFGQCWPDEVLFRSYHGEKVIAMYMFLFSPSYGLLTKCLFLFWSATVVKKIFLWKKKKTKRGALFISYFLVK